MKIVIKDFTNTALSEKSGLELREKILYNIKNKPEEKIDLDFQGIDLFATPFFNSFVGYFILSNQKEVFDKLVSFSELSDLGKQTYEHSYNNALDICKKGNANELSSIIDDQINSI